MRICGIQHSAPVRRLERGGDVEASEERHGYDAMTENRVPLKRFCRSRVGTCLCSGWTLGGRHIVNDRINVQRGRLKSNK